MAADIVSHESCPNCNNYYMVACVRKQKECLEDIFNRSLSANDTETVKDILTYLARCNSTEMIDYLWSVDAGELLKDDCTRWHILMECIISNSQSSFSLLLEKGFLSVLDHTCDHKHDCSIREFLSSHRLSRYTEMFNIMEKVEEQCYSIKDPGMM